MTRTTATRPAARRLVVRGAVTLVAVVVAVGTIGAAHVVGVPSVTGHPAGRTVTPVPADARRVCAGSLLRLSDETGADATAATRVGHQSVVAAADPGDVERSALGRSTTGGSDPTVITAPAGTRTPTVAGSGVQQVDQDDLAGLAAASCDDPSTSTWLVGGSTETGRTSLVTLSNPTDVNATVDLDVFDASGRVRAPGTTGIVVAPRTQRVVPLAGFVSDAASTVVHVRSSGGQIVAVMQESVVRTLTPGGVDIVQGAASPSRSQTIPGVVLRRSDDVRSGADTADAAPVVRLFVPGTRSARIQLAITTADGGGTTVSTTADAGSVTDVPLDDFPDGVYSISVTASVPLVAGARTSTPTAGSRLDLGWFASAPALRGRTVADVAAGPGAAMTFVNGTREDATVRLEPADGDTATLTVPSGSTATTSVRTATPLTIRGAAGLSAAVTYQGAEGIAGFPVRPDATASAPITIYP